MKTLIEDETDSFYNYLSKGCKLCQEGAKLVLFVTGLCPRNCFYCPLSEERREDRVFANERPVLEDSDVLEEARLMDALGTGITGGEPLLKLDLVLHYIHLLKSEFGREHHIHLYTSLAPDRKTLEMLAEAGLDEIRFHPPQQSWGDLKNSPYALSLKTALELGLAAGIEIPALLGAEKVPAFLDSLGAFLNLNELEFSDTNSEAMKTRGFALESDISNAACGSRALAREACAAGKKVHFCSSTYKDAVQLRKRLQRIAKNTARSFDEVTEDGTLLYGQIETGDQQLAASLLQDLEVPEEFYQIKAESIEIAWWVLEEIKEDLQPCKSRLSVIERYPFEGGLVIELIPL